MFSCLAGIWRHPARSSASLGARSAPGLPAGPRRRARAALGLALAFTLTAAPAASAAAKTGRVGTSGHRASIQPRVVGGIVNGTFETNTFLGWTQVGMTHVVSGGAHSGTYSAELGSNGVSHTASITQTFTEPTGTPTLSFWYNVLVCTKFALGTTADYATATLTDNTTSTTTTPLAKTCPAIATGWQQISVPVTAGHSYTLALIMFTSSSDGSRLRFDDIGAVGLTVNKSANKASVNQGGTVQYTVTVTNAGQIDYTGAAFSDSLSGALDDAVYNGDAAATAGTAGYTSPNLTWTGDLAVGASATVTYSMTANNPDVGDLSMTDTITSATAGNNCATGSTDPNCTVTATVAVSAVLSITVPTSVDLGSTSPGHSLSAALDPVTVIDRRGLSNAAWTTSVSATAFTTGGGTTPETIATTNISYWSGPVTASVGTATRTPGQLNAAAAQTLSSTRTAFSSATGTGITSVSWTPTLVVNVPSAAVAGTYTATLSHSVA